VTLRLILIRHAKSDWDDPMLDDIDRPLNPRGEKDAPRIGQWLAAQSFVPDQILCSAARRTQETTALITAALPAAPRIEVLPALYNASADRLLATIRKSTAPTLAVVAHNPGIGELADRLIKARPDHTRFAQYPTGATTVIDFDLPAWKDVGPRKGGATAFVTPHDLAPSD
jgi:phosphohistidine phosphatase